MVFVEFSTRNTILAGVIRLFTWSWASHVDLVLPDGRLLSALPAGGVGVRPWAPADRVERYAVDAGDEVLDLALSQLGKPYDWPGILGLGLRRAWSEDDSWFCSELVAWAFQEAGRPLLRAEDAYRITPRDLLLSPALQAAPPRV